MEKITIMFIHETLTLETKLLRFLIKWNQADSEFCRNGWIKQHINICSYQVKKCGDECKLRTYQGEEKTFKDEGVENVFQSSA